MTISEADQREFCRYTIEDETDRLKEEFQRLEVYLRTLNDLPRLFDQPPAWRQKLKGWSPY